MKDESLKQYWDADGVVSFMRDDFECVYCGKDMLESYDITYHGYAMDHLLPASKYPELDAQAWNLFLACKGCNSLKRDWDPNNPPLYIQGSQPNVTVRLELLNRAKDYVKRKRQDREALFQREQQALRRALQSLRNGLPAKTAK